MSRKVHVDAIHLEEHDVSSEFSMAVNGPVSSLPYEKSDDVISRIMRLSEQPDVISFAGGFPAREVQDWRILRQLTLQALNKSKNMAFGYGPTAGITELRGLLASHMWKLGRETSVKEVLITGGGIAGLDLIAATYLRPGNSVIVGSPCYLGALEVFRNHRVNIISVPMTSHGFDLELLEQALITAEEQGEAVKYIYTVPAFDNPTGVTSGLEHRNKLIKLAIRHKLWILEDGAYQELYFDSPPASMLAALSPDRVIHVNTFSKMLCPGFRLGWITAPTEIISKLSCRKQAWDQCSSTLGQQVMVAALSTEFMAEHLQFAREVYSRRRDLVINSLDQELSDIATWNVPGGGFYIWVQLPEAVSADAVSDMALANSNVAMLPGTSFYAKDPDQNTLRLSFSCVDETRIAEGIRGLRREVVSHMGPKLRSLAT